MSDDDSRAALTDDERRALDEAIALNRKMAVGAKIRLTHDEQRALDEARALDRKRHELHAQVRKSFVEHGKLPRQPHDCELANLVHLVERHRSAPVQITHGVAHKALRGAVRTLLALPGLIAAAEGEAKAARAEGRATDIDRFARLSWALLSAAEPFREISCQPDGPTSPPRAPEHTAAHAGGPAARRRDSRSHWYGWARLMAQEIRHISYACGKQKCSFGHATAPGALVLTDLIGKPVEQVIEALRERPGKK
jgi:hypothetical protein